MAKKTLGRKSAPKARAGKAGLQLSDEDRDLVGRLAERTGLGPRDVLARALAGYAAAGALRTPVGSADPYTMMKDSCRTRNPAIVRPGRRRRLDAP